MWYFTYSATPCPYLCPHNQVHKTVQAPTRIPLSPTRTLVSHYPRIQLNPISHYPVSHYPRIPLPPCPTTPVSHYPSIPLPPYPTTTVSHYPESNYPRIPLHPYPTTRIPLPSYPTSPISNYPCIQLPPYPTTPVSNYPRIPLFLYPTLTYIPDWHIYQGNNKILTECIFDFLNPPFLSNQYHPLQPDHIPALSCLNSNTVFGQSLNIPTSVVRLHSQNNAMTSNNQSHHHNKINQFSSLNLLLIYPYHVLSFYCRFEHLKMFSSLTWCVRSCDLCVQVAWIIWIQMNKINVALGQPY